MWIIRARRCPKTIDASFQWIEPRCPKTHESNPHAIYFSSFPCSYYITVFVWAKCFLIRHFSSEDVEGGASWKKIFLFPRPLEADWHDELCNHLFAKLKVIWISCCADSLWPKMGEAWRKSKLSWVQTQERGNQDIIRIIRIIIQWQTEIIPDGADQETIPGRSTGGEIKRDQRVKGGTRGEQRCLLVWNYNSYI